jgi:flavin reductase (DIM6/NTAB) family NADH-FMN oxidoreductase RutF
MPIDQDLKRCIGQMAKGVQVVGACHAGVARAYTSHWVTQVSFEEPILMASTSPKHDTHPLIVASGRFGVSILAGDQIAEGQYFSYPGRRFHRIAHEYLVLEDGLPFVPESIAWLACEVFDRVSGRFDHDLFFARVTRVWERRLGEDPLVYSARHGWRIADRRAREKGVSIRDQLLARLEATGPADVTQTGDPP